MKVQIFFCHCEEFSLWLLVYYHSHNLLEAEQFQFSVRSGRQCLVSALSKGKQHTMLYIQVRYVTDPVYPICVDGLEKKAVPLKGCKITFSKLMFSVELIKFLMSHTVKIFKLEREIFIFRNRWATLNTERFRRAIL